MSEASKTCSHPPKHPSRLFCVRQKYFGEFKTERLAGELSPDWVPPNFWRFSIIRRKKTKGLRRLKKIQQQRGVVGYVCEKNWLPSGETDAVKFCQIWTHMRHYHVSPLFYFGQIITRRSPR